MNNMNLPIETIRDGNKITKICAENIYKMIGRIKNSMNITYSRMASYLHQTSKKYKGVNGFLIIGKGVSQPCITDAFDEEIGNNIAFMKAKLNANIKKYNLLKKIRRDNLKLEQVIEEEMAKVTEYIELDLDGIRKHNPDYLRNSENWW